MSVTITQITTPAIAGEPLTFQVTDEFPLAGSYELTVTATGHNHFIQKASLAVTVGAAPQPVPIPAPLPSPIPTPVPSPTPTPTPTPTPSPSPSGRQLLGMYRIVCPYSSGVIAIDWSTNTLYVGGHGQGTDILKMALPPLVLGSDITNAPILQAAEVIAGFAGPNCFNNGLAFFRGKLWTAPKNGYDTNPPSLFSFIARDGDTIPVLLGRQAYSGFVKTGANTDPRVGGGGYCSGQGWATGPTLATLAGQSLINFPQTSVWDGREYRDTNYYPVNHVDSWVAQEPRLENGVLVGKWASDRIHGGGLLLPEGYTYWPWQGTGDIDYARQSETFGAGQQTSAYVYDRNTYQRIGWTLTDLGEIGGQELGPDGKVYLCELDAWQSAGNMYKTDPVIKVFG